MYENLRPPHGKAVEYLIKYLIAIRDKDIILTRDKTKSIEV